MMATGLREVESQFGPQALENALHGMCQPSRFATTNRFKRYMLLRILRAHVHVSSWSTPTGRGSLS